MNIPTTGADGYPNDLSRFHLLAPYLAPRIIDNFATLLSTAEGIQLFCDALSEARDKLEERYLARERAAEETRRAVVRDHSMETDR